MPYSPVTTTTTIMSPRQPAEDHLADGFGGEGESSKRPLKTMPDHISSIFVHPPTPERDAEPPTLAPPVPTAKPAPSQSVPTSSLHLKGVPSRASPRASPMNSPRIEAGPFVFGSPARGAPASLPTQVLPEVRSPPRRPLMIHADSLTITHRRGRRPKLFGFTELPESSSSASSANSSRANSRSNSPERHVAETAALPSPLHFSTVPSPPQSSVLASASHRTASGPGPSGSNAVLPRRPSVRAKSAENLPTLNVTEAAPSPPPQHIPPRRRENGLKLDFTGIVPIATAPTSGSQSARVVSPYTATLIRKKSGEVVKSALKSAGPLSAAGTPLSDSDRPIFESKSCPTTPSCPKYVHFDTQLERVKLFLHDQKPQNVSRDGSPHLDWTTSDGEEYPFPPTDEEREKEASAKVLQISLPNFPTSHPPDAELYLESLFLDDDRKTLKGMIMCKNLSFQKWVAVRFTLDWWQTTSEVSATHKESVRGGAYDRFAFVIKLQDLMNKIEEKTLFLAIRFNIDGREIWDSNGGQNYQVTFAKVAPPPTKLGAARAGNLRIENGMGKSIGGKNSQWSVHGRDNDDRMADLRARLNRLTADDPDAAPKLSPTRDRTFAFSPRKNTLSFGGSPQSSPRKGSLALDGGKAELLPGAGPALAARYDFNAAFKGSKDTRRGSNSPNSSNTDLAAMRTGLLSFAETNKRNGSSAAVEFFSPRSTPVALPAIGPTAAPKPDAFFSAPPTYTSDRLSPTPSPTTGTVPSPRPAGTGAGGAAQGVPALHVQGPSPEPVEIADPLNDVPAAASSSLSSAAPKSPSPRPSLSRARTSPAVLHSSLPELSGGSPPQLDGSSSATDTPTDSPRSPPDVALAKWSPSSKSDSSDVSLASMNSFIEQFCWAGDGSGLDHRRTHSTSALDQYFASAHSPSQSGMTTPRPTHHHSGSDSFTYSPASSTTSYYTAYSGGAGTPRSHELDEVEGMLSANAGRRSVTPTAAATHRRPERAYATGNMSPPIFC